MTFHFGINLDVAGFRVVEERMRLMAPIARPAHVVDAGTPRERHEMCRRCPSGYRIEIKGC